MGAPMTANELMQGLMALSCGITAAAIAFQIGRVWERQHAREICTWAQMKREEAAEKIEEAAQEIAAIQAEREVMREVAAEWNRILEKAHGHHANQVRTAHAGMARRH